MGKLMFKKMIKAWGLSFAGILFLGLILTDSGFKSSVMICIFFYFGYVLGELLLESQRDGDPDGEKEN